MPIDPNIPLQAGNQLPKFGPDWGVIQNALKTQIAMQQARDVQQSENALKQAFSAQQPGEMQFSPQTINNLGARSPDAAYQAQRMNALAGPMATNSALQQAYGNRDNLKPGTMIPKDEVIADVLRRNPAAGMELIKLSSAQQTHETAKSTQASEQYKRLQGLWDEGEARILAEYQANAAKWGDAGKAQDKANADLAALKRSLKDTAGATDAFLNTLPPGFSEQTAQAKLIAKNAGEVAKEQQLSPIKGEIYTGTDKTTGEAVRFRYTPDGPVSADPLPDGQREKVDVNSLTNIDKFGHKEAKEFAQSKPVVVLDKDGKTVGTYAGRESTKGIGFVRGDTGEPIAPPEGGKVILGTDKDASEEAKEAAASMVAHYDVPPPPLGSRGTKQNVELLAKAKEINPNYKAEKYYASRALREGYARTTTGSPGFKIGSINTATQHFAVLNELSNKLDNKDPAAANYIINYVRQNILGKENVTDFNIASQVVADEALKAVINAAGGVTDRDKLQAQLTNTRAPTQIKGAVNTLSELMAGQARTLRTQARKNGWSDEDWEGYLEPDAAELLAPYLKEKGKGPAATPPAAGTKAEPAAVLPPVPVPLGSGGLEPAAKGAPPGPVPTPADFGAQKYLTNKQTGETWVKGPDGKVVPYVAGQK